MGRPASKPSVVASWLWLVPLVEGTSSSVESLEGGGGSASVGGGGGFLHFFFPFQFPIV